MRQWISILLLFFPTFTAFAQVTPDTAVIVSEIMYDPPADANSADEFVEVFNTSFTQSFNLRNWRLGDATSLRTIADTTAANTGNATLLPRRFAVIFTGPDFRRAFAYYRPLIPAGALILRTTASLAFNNTGTETVRLLNERGDTLASFTYTGVALNRGRSLEKIILNRNNAPTNFAPSLNIGGTPGSMNSVTPKDRDLALRIDERFSTPPQTTITIPYTIQNRGLLPFGNGAITRIFEDRNRNGLGDIAEQISTSTLLRDLAPRDSIRQFFTYTPRSSEPVDFILTLSLAGDEDTTNNIVRTRLFLGTAQRAVVINEIMYAPIQDPNDFKPDQPEYVELFNRSSAPVDLRGWFLTDAPNERGEFSRFFFAQDSLENYVLQPNEYAVIAPDRATVRDSTRLVRFFTYLQRDRTAKLFTSVRSSPTSRTNLSEFGLRSDGDLVALYDHTGFLVDSVRYSPRWHHPFFSSTRGLSLERISPNAESNDARNWTTSTNREFGGTPARQNSVFAPPPDLSGSTSTLALSPNPFSPDGDGRDDFLVIRYQLQSAVN
ncbi:MAG: lamin tail domain-containing protein [Chloroherpetonaceae bacterium]|nr:lamin tail domain-containing protein [Chloroherpetonaceae bacterium]